MHPQFKKQQQQHSTEKFNTRNSLASVITLKVTLTLSNGGSHRLLRSTRAKLVISSNPSSHPRYSENSEISKEELFPFILETVRQFGSKMVSSKPNAKLSFYFINKFVFNSFLLRGIGQNKFNST